MKVAAAVLGIVLLVGLAPAAADAPPRDLDDLRAQIARVLQRAHVPGAGIALVEGDRVLWAGGVGIADLARRRPVTADTLFRVASITKSFIALALVQLAERGRLRLDDPVRALAPELAIENRWDAERPITVAHVLEHTAGFDDARPNEWAAPLGDERVPLADALARNPGSRIARWRPGSRFSYSNPGYTVAGYLIEKLTGRAYEDVVTRALLRPLGMTGAALRLTPEVDARLARGYGSEDDAPVAYQALYHRPAGNLMASPRELAALVQLALGRGRYRGVQLVSPAGMARIERSETAWLAPGDASYGLGNYGDVVERVPLRGHDGALPGFLSSYRYSVDRGFGFVVLLNSRRSAAAMRAIHHLIVEYLLAGAPVPPPPRAEVPEDELARWAGAYRLAAPRHQLFAFLERLLPGVELRVAGGVLFAQRVPASGDPIELVPLGSDRFRLPAASGSQVALGRDAEGRRILVVGGAYLVEEPRWRTLAYAIAPKICLAILATGVALVFGAFGRRAGPAPGIGWPLCVLAPMAGVPWLLDAGAGVLGELNGYTLGICAGTLAFALGAAGSAVQALRWLPYPGSALGKLHRLVFALAACTVTAYLAAYDIIGIRLWSY